MLRGIRWIIAENKFGMKAGLKNVGFYRTFALGLMLARRVNAIIH